MTDKVLPLFPMRRDYPLDPAPELARMQAVSPIGRVRLFQGDEAWIVTGYQDAERLLRLPSLSVDFRTPGYPIVHPTHAKFAPGILTHIDPPEHNKYRRMLAAEFTVKRVERLREQVTGVVEQLFEQMIAVGPGVDMMQTLAIPAPALMICQMLGVPYEQRDYFVGLADTFLGGHAPVDEAMQADQDLRKLLRDVIRAKRSEPDEGLLSRVVESYVDAEELDEDVLVTMAEGVLIAGFHTTSSMIGLGTIALVENPDQFEELRGDLTLAPSAVEEMLRYLTVTHLGRHRAATEEVEVDDVVIQPGDGVIIASDIANRDPNRFEDPNKLILRNGGKRPHQAFGIGVHQCVGAALARLELGIVYTMLAERLPTVKLALPIEELEFTHESTVNSVRALPIAW